MDPKLKSALEFSKYQHTLSLQKKIFKERLQSQLLFGFNGGMFKIDQTLISFVETLISKGRIRGILLDINEIPVSIDNFEEFLDIILEKYFQALYEYHENYQKLKSKRSVETLIDL